MSEFKPRSQIMKSGSGLEATTSISHSLVIARKAHGSEAGPKPGGRVCLSGPDQWGTWSGVGIAGT